MPYHESEQDWITESSYCVRFGGWWQVNRRRRADRGPRNVHRCCIRNGYPTKQGIYGAQVIIYVIDWTKDV